jgi:hypothetical protein
MVSWSLAWLVFWLVGLVGLVRMELQHLGSMDWIL